MHDSHYLGILRQRAVSSCQNLHFSGKNGYKHETLQHDIQIKAAWNDK